MKLSDLAKEFELDCKVRELSKKTTANYAKQISYFLNFLEKDFGISEVNDVLPYHIKLFLGKFQSKGCKPTYINNLLKALKCFFRYAYTENYTNELVTSKIKNLKEPKVLIHTFTPLEISNMVNYYNKMDYLSIRNKVIIMILFDTGIRIAELIGLKPEQVQDNYFIIHGKGRKERIVPKSPLVSKWLMKYMVVRESYFEYKFASSNLFLSKNGKPLTDEAISKFLKTAAKAIGVNSNVRISPHTFRHTFAQQQLKNGLDLYSLSRLLGHENVSITQRYLGSIQDSQILTASFRTGVLANLNK